MRAENHTILMLSRWRTLGIRTADLAVRRPDAVMLWHRDIALEQLPLPWARAQNLHHGEVYIRPARGYHWPIIFLDDVPLDVAGKVAARYSSLLVHTSREGGCHLWVHCTRILSESDRHATQRLVAARIGADRASTSGEHLGRLAGMKNWKRAGQWVNVVQTPQDRPSWEPHSSGYQMAGRDLPVPCPPLLTGPERATSSALLDPSPSGREWGWVCGALEAGVPPQMVYDALLIQARARRGPDALRYATRTVRRACLLTAVPFPTSGLRDS